MLLGDISLRDKHARSSAMSALPAINSRQKCYDVGRHRYIEGVWFVAFLNAVEKWALELKPH